MANHLFRCRELLRMSVASAALLLGAVCSKSHRPKDEYDRMGAYCITRSIRSNLSDLIRKFSDVRLCNVSWDTL
jgi:hypothetical protein